MSEFLSENFQFFEVKFSVFLNRRVFVMSNERTAKDDYPHISKYHCYLVYGQTSNNIYGLHDSFR